MLRDAKGRQHTFEHHPGAFAHNGETITLVRPSGRAAAAPAVKRSAAGGLVAAEQTARVAQASRLWVEGAHDARFLERVWVTSCASTASSSNRWAVIDDLVAEVRRFGPGPAGSSRSWSTT